MFNRLFLLFVLAIVVNISLFAGKPSVPNVGGGTEASSSPTPAPAQEPSSSSSGEYSVNKGALERAYMGNTGLSSAAAFTEFKALPCKTSYAADFFNPNAALSGNSVPQSEEQESQNTAK